MARNADHVVVLRFGQDPHAIDEYASKIKSPGTRNGTREQAAKSLFTEGQSQLKEPTTLYSGLMQLQGVMQRWPDLKVADDAKRILLEYDARPEHPWEQDDIAEQRKFLIARARSLDAYASSDLPAQYANERQEMLEAAINLWISSFRSRLL